MIIQSTFDIDKIIKHVNDSSCVCYCFGAGAMGKDFADFACDFGMSSNRLVFVDNDKNKHGKKVEVQSHVVPIISKSDMIKAIKKGDIIVISTLACKEIYDDLNTEEVLGQIDVCFLQLLLLKSLKIGEKVHLYSNKEQLIPKKIHYCWFGKKEIPQEFQRYIDGWKQKCPDFEVIQWDENNYDITKSLYMKEAYEQKRWGFVPDYVRLDIIYSYGGIYLDTDVEIVNLLDPLLCYKAFFSINASLKPNLGNGFGAVKKHPLIKKMRDYYDDFKFILENGEINARPCTEYQYPVLKDAGFKISGKYSEHDDYIVLPFDIMCGYHHWIDEYMISENAVAVHHCKRTWHDEILRKRAQESVEFLKSIK